MLLITVDTLLPGLTLSCQLILSCLPGASLVPPRLSNWFFPTSLVLSCLPGACLVPCKLSNSSFLPRCPRTSAGRGSASRLPGASLVPCKLSNESFPASLVSLRLCNWAFPASLVPPCQRQSCAPSGFLKASLCCGQPTVEPTPGSAANRADRH